MLNRSDSFSRYGAVRRCLVAATCILAGCSAAPIVSDYNGDSVKILFTDLSSDADKRAKGDPEATRICRGGGRKRAEWASQVIDAQNYTVTYLYICQN